MTPINLYSLASHSGDYESWPLTTPLLFDGKALTISVPGYVIEAQYETPHGSLLITSYDCPYEESNAFMLLNSEHEIIAKAELVIPYSSFLLHEHWSIDAHTLGLHYFTSIFYTLQVQKTGFLSSSPKLKLRRKLTWRTNPRMVAAHDRLNSNLAAIKEHQTTQ